MELRTTPNNSQAGTSYSEVLVAVLLVATFFASVFELNAVSLRYIDASKESIAAMQSVQDRCETLRNLSFTDLTSADNIQTLLATPANGSDFCQKATEVVKISAYPTENGITQFTRGSNGTVTKNSTATSLGETLVQVNVTTTWNLLGGRARSEETTTIVSNGTKK